MNEVHILASGNVVMVAKFKEDQLVLMARRGWIVQDKWLIKGRTVSTMTVEHLEAFLKEVA
jgi:hypothetical protein